MNDVFKIVRDETALTFNGIENRCRRLSKFYQDIDATPFFWEVDHPQSKISPNLLICYKHGIMAAYNPLYLRHSTQVILVSEDFYARCFYIICKIC